MGKPLKVGLVLAVLLALGAGFVATSGPAPPAPTPPGAFAFAALGDAPYYPWEELQYRLVLQALDAHDLRWVLHVGDVFWRPCSDELYRRSLGRFNGLRHPVVYTPGDNEWTDCWEPGSGGFEPRARLGRLREIFFADPTRSLGGRRMPLVSQARSRGGSEPGTGGEAPPEFPELVENARWRHEGMVFATVHLPGSRNALEPFPGRTPDDDAAAVRRTEGAAAWTQEAFGEAAATGASAVVLAFHASPGFGSPEDDPYRRAYEPFLEVLEEEVERFGGPVLLIHGDDHVYTVDRPLVRRTTGEVLPNLTRLQVPGSPQVGWVRVVVTPGAEAPFAFEDHVVPRWKYW